jgi:hypothetical protein|tara:strand:+ start:1181 stop:1543 length:363 start_codon:yes stop_codon:yes gene_type:complete
MDLDFELYKGKKYSNLLKDVVINSEQKKDQIDILVSDLRSMIKTPNDAIVIVPLIKDYLDVSVRNDEQLVKLAAIVQRLISSDNKGTEEIGGLSEEERQQLMAEVGKITDSMNIPIEIKK